MPEEAGWVWDDPDLVFNDEPEVDTTVPIPAARVTPQPVEGSQSFCPSCGDLQSPEDAWRDICTLCYTLWAQENGRTCIQCGASTYNEQTGKGWALCLKCKKDKRIAANAERLNANPTALASPAASTSFNPNASSSTCPHCGKPVELKKIIRIGNNATS